MLKKRWREMAGKMNRVFHFLEAETKDCHHRRPPQPNMKVI
jgi:hypothetical protein